MKDRISRIVFGQGLLFLGSFFLTLLFPFLAQAYAIENYQEKVEDRFVISPVNLELNLSPGETSVQKMTIINRLGRTTSFKIEKEDFTGSEDPEKSTVFLGEGEADFTSAKNWIMPEVDVMELNHGDRLTLPFTVTVPKEATSGSHYGALFVSVKNDDSGGGKDKIKLISRVGLLVLINVAGQNIETGEISDFSTDRKFYRQGPAVFSTVFKNTGNIYQKVKGEISVKNIFGSEVDHLTIKDWIVLSQSSRRQDTDWTKKWLVGRYTAKASVFYGLGGNLSDTQEVVFYAFPWHIALLLLAVLMMLYFALKYLFSKFEIKRKKKN